MKADFKMGDLSEADLADWEQALGANDDPKTQGHFDLIRGAIAEIRRLREEVAVWRERAVGGFQNTIEAICDPDRKHRSVSWDNNYDD